MENLLKNKKIIFVCIILLLIVFVIYIFSINSANNDELVETNRDNYNYLEKYSSNQYVPVYVTEEDMAKKYLNDYKNNILNNLEDAYNSLNYEYKQAKFGSLDKFKEYINEYISLATYSMEVDKYSVSSIDGNKIFNVYDENGYQYIFKEISIMNYEVYLDEYTVEIK